MDIHTIFVAGDNVAPTKYHILQNLHVVYEVNELYTWQIHWPTNSQTNFRPDEYLTLRTINCSFKWCRDPGG